MSWLLLAVQVLMGGVMVAAAAGKLLRTDEFVAALRLSRAPEPLVRAATVVVPVLEAALGFAVVLTIASGLTAALAATALLLAVFTLWMVSVRVRGIYVRCGCFGASSGEVGPRTIGRNVALLGIALAGVVLSRNVATPLPGWSLAAVMAAVAAALVVALSEAFWMARPHMVLSQARLEAATASDWEGV